jgi:rSAM/selenodomain-associated transferase 2
MPRLSVVIPVLSDSDALARLLADTPPVQGVELVVADGGDDPQLESLLARHWPSARVIRSGPGRGVQMNAGADATTAPLLLFLHADSRLPAGWDEALFTLPKAAVGGWFRFALDDAAWQARLIERLVSWRVRLLRLPYGDQGIFVRRDTFNRLGGFKPWPLMEDVEFVRRLVSEGPVAELRLPLATAARRWRRDGWFRRSARNLAILSLYLAGVSPSRLARWYAGS